MIVPLDVAVGVAELAGLIEFFWVVTYQLPAGLLHRQPCDLRAVTRAVADAG